MTIKEYWDQRLEHWRATEGWGVGGVNIKRRIDVAHWKPTGETPIAGWEYSSRYWDIQRTELLVGINKGLIRLRYPDGSRSKVQYLEKASIDLKSLSALFICHLLPPEILADKIDEEYGGIHSQAAEILRQWTSVKREYPE